MVSAGAAGSFGQLPALQYYNAGYAAAKERGLT